MFKPKPQSQRTSIKPCPASEQCKAAPVSTLTQTAAVIGQSRESVRNHEDTALFKIRSVVEASNKGVFPSAQSKAARLVAEAVEECERTGADLLPILVRKIAAMECRMACRGEQKRGAA